MGPKTRAIFAHAPALGFETAFLGRRLQGPCRQPSDLILFGIEDGERLSDDFAFGVTLEALRARVPGGHPPIGVEQIDRIVLDRIDQDLKSLGMSKVSKGAR